MRRLVLRRRPDRAAHAATPARGGRGRVARGRLSRQQRRRRAARAVQPRRGGRELPRAPSSSTRARARADQPRHRALLRARSAGSGHRGEGGGVRGAPDAPQPHYVLGLIAKSENQVDDAEAAFEKVLAIDATDLGARVNLAQLRCRSASTTRAVELLRPAVAAEPYHVTATYNLGVALTRAGKTEEGQQVDRASSRRCARAATARRSRTTISSRDATPRPSRRPGAEARSSTPRRRRRAVLSRRRPSASPRAIGGPALTARRSRSRRRSRSGRRPSGTRSAALPGRHRRVHATCGRRGLRRRLGPRRSAPPSWPATTTTTSAPICSCSAPARTLLLHQRADGTFEDTTAAAGIPEHRPAPTAPWPSSTPITTAISTSCSPAGWRARPTRCSRNNGNGTFADVSAASGIAAASGAAVGLVPTDFDNRRDVDLLVARGRPARRCCSRTCATAPSRTSRPRSASPPSAPAPGRSAPSPPATSTRTASPTSSSAATTAGVLAASDGRGRFTPTDVARHRRRDRGAVRRSRQRRAARSSCHGDVRRRRAAAQPGPRRRRAAGRASVAGRDGARSATPRPSPARVAGGRRPRRRRRHRSRACARRRCRARPLVVLRNDGGNRQASLRVAADRPRQQPQRGRLEGRAARRQPAAEARDRERLAGRRARAISCSASARAPAPTSSASSGPPASCRPRFRGEPDARPRPASRRRAARRRWPRSPSSIASPRRARISSPGTASASSSSPTSWAAARWATCTRPASSDTPDPEEFTRIDGAPAAAARRPLRAARHQRARGDAVPRSARLIAVDHPTDVEVHPREGLRRRRRFRRSSSTPPPAPGPLARAIDDAGRDVTDRAARRSIASSSTSCRSSGSAATRSRTR